MSQIRYRGACTIPKDAPLRLILVGGGMENTDVFMDKAEVKIRYAIGRTNKPNEWSGKSGTANFHVNPVFACVTATQWSNRGANS